MKKLLLLLGCLAFVSACQSPTDSQSIPLRLTGTGHFSPGYTTTMKAVATYTGTGTLTYDWTLGGQKITWNHTDTEVLTLPTSGTGSMTVQVTVSDGNHSGTANGTLSW